MSAAGSQVGPTLQPCVAEGASVAAAARFACAAASLKCAGCGARESIPTRAEVLARLAETRIA